MEKLNDVWVEKYRPFDLDGIVGQDEIVKAISEAIEKGNLSNLIFEGKAGTGKTTTAKAIAHELDADFMELNSSEERGIEIVRGKITKFAKHLSFEKNQIKICFLDEADSMTTEAQMCLRPVMEKYTRKLPRTPIKEKEKRKEGFEYRHGTGATELDALEALHKGEMARIIKEIILPYIDIDAWNEVNRKNDEIQAKVRDFLQDKVTNVLEELDVSEYDDYEPDTGEEIDDKRDNWLYDSNRDYEDQMENYKNWRKKSD